MNKKNNFELITNQERRDLLKGVVAVTAAVASTAILADTEEHHHEKTATADNANHYELIEAALSCVKNGQLCSAHCLDLIKTGDTSTAQCLTAVTQMLTMCSTLSQMAAYKSPHLGMLAKVCAEVCADCEKECRKHEDKHAACKACADSCAACIKECQKIAA